MRISDWSSDVCSSDLCLGVRDMIRPHAANDNAPLAHDDQLAVARKVRRQQAARMPMDYRPLAIEARQCVETLVGPTPPPPLLLKQKGTCLGESEEQTSELQSTISHPYAVFCLHKKNNITQNNH